MRQAFTDWVPREDSVTLVGLANEVCADYAGQGYDLTLRQLYYQLVARGHIANNQKSYKRLGDVINNARLAGLLDWQYIVDRTRNLAANGHWDSPEEVIRSAAGGYAIDKWADQPNYVEVWVEKEALAGVVGRSADQLDVAYFSCRGYVSQSEMYSAGARFRRKWKDGRVGYLVHLGDHDPSGIDMTRDIESRLVMFSGAGAPEVRRIALNMDQVRQYSPPPNPAKITDSRAADYIARFGNESWELDALDPATLDALITTEVLSLRDEERWEAAQEREQQEQSQLQAVSDRWEEIRELVNE